MRLNYHAAAPDTISALAGVKTHLGKTFPEPGLKVLVELRTSQINGCAYCVDMHSKEARQLGETQQRLDCLCVWRDVSFFTDRERAALALAEAVTQFTVTHVPEADFTEARAHFTDRDLTNLVAIIAMMNLWNRLSVTFGNTPAPQK